MPIPGFYMCRNCILSKKTGNVSFLFQLIPCSIFWEFCCVPISKWSQITNHKFATATHRYGNAPIFVLEETSCFVETD
jgi:hypothetical protein